MSKLHRIIMFSLPISPIAMIVVLLIIKPELLQYPKALAKISIPALLIAMCLFAVSFVYKRIMKRTLEETVQTQLVVLWTMGAAFWLMNRITQVIVKTSHNAPSTFDLILAPFTLTLSGITFFIFARTERNRRNFFIVSGVLVIFIGILGTVIEIVGLK